MNKFDFIAGNKTTLEKIEYHHNSFLKDFKRSFTFKFVAGNYPFENVIRERQDEDDETTSVRHTGQFERSDHGNYRLPGQIIKTDIQESVARQLKEMISIVRKNEELIYVKMNKTTKDKFRIYYNYEVSYPPRQQTEEDREVGGVVGCIMGIKIIQDNSLNVDIVVPVVRNGRARLKFESVFKTITN